MSFVSNRSAALRRLARDRAGTSTLEMGLVMPVLMLALIGSIEVGRYYFTVQSLRTLTAEAARIAMIDSTKTSTTGCTVSNSESYTTSTVRRGAAKKTPFLSTNSETLGLCVLRTVSSDGAEVTITVNAQYPFNSFLPRTTFLTSTLSDSTTFTYRIN